MKRGNREVASTHRRTRSSRRATLKRRTIAVQLGLTVRASGRGGWRARAGRKAIPFERRDRVAHRRRPALPRNCPLHVTVRLVEGLPRLRGARTWRYVRRCIALAHKPGFRVVQFSMLDDHLHLIVEADDQPIRANLRLCGTPVTLPPRTWLLRVGWTKDGPLDPGAVPGGR